MASISLSITASPLQTGPDIGMSLPFEPLPMQAPHITVQQPHPLLAFAASACVLVLALGASPVAAAVVTYQGVLKSSGAPLNGTVDMRFRLYAVAFGAGIPLGSLAINNVTVVDGLVNVDLDFGPNAFNGNDRWLEIDVANPANGGVGPFTTLTPRQRIGFAPMAQHALNASLSGSYGSAVSFTNAANAFTGSGAGLANLNASNLTTGTVGSSLLSGSYTNALTLSNASNAISGTFSGNGSGLSSLNAFNIGTGNLNAARLPLSGQWIINDLLRIDNNSLVVDPATDRIGIGVVSPTHTLDVNGNMSIDGSTLVVDDALNRVGIGTSSPTNTLHVSGATRLQGSTTIDGTAVFNQPVVLNSTMSFSPIERYLAYGPSDFFPVLGTGEYVASVAHYALNSGTEYACRVPIHVPHGARLKSARIWIADLSAASVILVRSIQKPLASLNEVVIDQESTTGTPGNVFYDLTFNDVIVDNTSQKYFIEARWTVPAFASDIVVHGARATFEVTNYLP